MFEWYIPRLVVKNECPIDTCFNKIGHICAQNIRSTILCSMIMSTIWKTRDLLLLLHLTYDPKTLKCQFVWFASSWYDAGFKIVCWKCPCVITPTSIGQLLPLSLQREQLHHQTHAHNQLAFDSCPQLLSCPLHEELHETQWLLHPTHKTRYLSM